jgi:hypothetical protein
MPWIESRIVEINVCSLGRAARSRSSSKRRRCRSRIGLHRWINLFRGAGPHRAHAREPDTDARGIDYSLSSSVSSFVMELFQPLL